MRWPRVRFTVRAMMTAVAITASVLAYIHHKKSAAFRRVAEAHARKAADLAARAELARSSWEAVDSGLGYGAAYLARRDRMSEDLAGRWEDQIDGLKRDLERAESLLAYYNGLEEKYRRAAANPWLPIAPDPVPPRVSAVRTVVTSRSSIFD